MLKRDLTLYLVTAAGTQYKLPIYSDVRYSQTYAEEELNVKTLHTPTTLIKGGFTTKLNPGNFNFTIPVMDSTVAQALFTIFFKNVPESFTLYVIENGITVRLVTCIVEQLTFNFVKNALITATIAGQYSYSDNGTLTGTPAASQGATYTLINGISITYAGANVPNITGFSLEMSNRVSWVNVNRTMHSVTPPAPTEFYSSEKVISGNFSSNQDLNIPTYNNAAALAVKIKASETMDLDFEFPSILATTRPELDEVIKKGYDFRVSGNVNNIVRFKGVNIL